MDSLYLSNFLSFLKKFLASPVIILFLFIMIVAPVVYIGRFDHPMSDDFLNVIWTNLLQKQKSLYLEWSGRYFSDFIVSWTPVHWGSITGYRILIITNILVACSSFLLTIHRFLAAFTGYGKASRWYISLFATWLVINNMPSLGEAFYWYPSAITYNFAVTLFCWLVQTFIANYRQSGATLQRNRLVLQVILLFCIIGSNESSLLLADIVCLCVYVIQRFNKHERMQKQYLILLLFAIAFSAISILAPGNTVRQALIHRSLIHGLALWLFFTKELLLSWLYQPFFLIFTLVVFLIPSSGKIITPLRKYNIVAFFVFTVLIVYVMMLPGYWAAGSIPPARTINFVYMIFVLFWIYFIIMLKAYILDYFRRQNAEFTFPRQAIVVLSAIIIATLITTNAVRTTGYARMAMMIKNRLPQRYDREIRQRYHLLSSASGKDSAAIPAIKARTGNFLLFEDLYSIPNVWPNTAYEKYWKIKKVYIGDTTLLPLY